MCNFFFFTNFSVHISLVYFAILQILSKTIFLYVFLVLRPRSQLSCILCHIMLLCNPSFMAFWSKCREMSIVHTIMIHMRHINKSLLNFVFLPIIDRANCYSIRCTIATSPFHSFKFVKVAFLHRQPNQQQQKLCTVIRRVYIIDIH